MAIVIEEEKKRNVGPMIGWVAFFVIIAVAAYYIFFVTPQAVPITGTGTTAPNLMIPASNINPEAILNLPAFQALKPSTIAAPSPQGPAAVGRTNPFVAP